ncbi:glycogen/starch synthase [Saccharicrinis sp. FJH62]|uniref:glycogen/starch synthase n=1 Tax=Saccharicrinis sp. FJH62 TaxID=3344657 RepID=UPI0035D4FC8F
MEAKKVLFIFQEITPYVPESELSVIGRNLPQGIQEAGKEIRTFMPRYGLINERRNQLHEVIRLSGMNLIIDDTDHPLIIKVASIQAVRLQVYFIDNEDFFQRKAIVSDDEGKEFEDNDERAIFFARGVLETVKKLRWSPDIIHCHGWMSALVPLYIKKSYHDDPFFQHSKMVYSIYDNPFENTFRELFKEKILMPGVTPEDLSLVEKPDYENLNKLAIHYSDAVIQGSENINKNVKKFIDTENKKFLGYQSPESYIQAYDSFYDEILS